MKTEDTVYVQNIPFWKLFLSILIIFADRQLRFPHVGYLFMRAKYIFIFFAVFEIPPKK